jgi:uncharacterized membrane protein HdeD (DUF308 family)
VREFLLGFTSMGCLVVALIFFRHWRDSADRFFAMFAVAFLVFGVNRLMLAVLETDDEGRIVVYLGRLAAFLVIIAAIVDKNRAASAPRR